MGAPGSRAHFHRYTTENQQLQRLPLYPSERVVQQPTSDPLSDETLATLQRLAAPIEPALRAAFLTAVTSELRRYRPDEIGGGLVFRTAKALQREFLRPPARIARGVEKYG